MKRKFIASIFLLFCSIAGFSQTINQSLLAKAQAYTNEVSANYPSLTDSVNVARNAEIISRTEVITEPYQPSENYKKLSTIPLRNKYNPALTRDELNFNSGNFNPLKYFLNWYPETVTKYRVDNTNYVIVVHPKS